MKKTFTRWSLSIKEKGKRHLIGSFLPDAHSESAVVFLTRENAREAGASCGYLYPQSLRAEKVRVTVETI